MASKNNSLVVFLVFSSQDLFTQYNAGNPNVFVGLCIMYQYFVFAAFPCDTCLDKIQGRLDYYYAETCDE